jgi:hypothetical protein
MNLSNVFYIIEFCAFVLPAIPESIYIRLCILMGYYSLRLYRFPNLYDREKPIYLKKNSYDYDNEITNDIAIVID